MAATQCAATQTGPERSNGSTGFQATAITTKTGTHHQCLAWIANHATMSARIAMTNRSVSNQSLPNSSCATTSASAARIPGASALRW